MWNMCSDNTKIKCIDIMKDHKLYFPNLNGVRTIAAFMVNIFHIELIKSEFGIKNLFRICSFRWRFRCNFVFVLEIGFLITYLLLYEGYQTLFH